MGVLYMKYLVTLFLLSLVILIHELGHFIFASKVKLPIQIFSIGFGPKLFSFKYKETEYRISLIPLGGYVLPDIEDEAGFFNIPLYKRIIMTIGGPIANIILTIFCFSIICIMKYGFDSSILFIKPIQQTFLLMAGMTTSLLELFTGNGQLSGIIGIVSQGGDFIGSSIYNGLALVALISMNLAIINLIPIPILDGGKLLLYLLEYIHPKSKKLHYPLAIASWVFMFTLMVYATYIDIIQII